MLKVLVTGISVLFASVSSTSANSSGWVSAQPEYPAILYEGDISRETVAGFRAMLEEYPETTMVALNSDGGSVYAALEIAKDIDRLGLSTLIMEGNRCFSACSLIFLAGHLRYAVGKLGVHQISGTDDTSLTQAVVADIYDHLLDFGVEQEVLSAMFRTASDDIHVFTSAEVEAFGINRVQKATPAPDLSSRVTFQTVASTRNGHWEALLLRNEKNGHYLCALEAVSGGTTFRIVNYMTKNDAFVELLDLPFALNSGPQNLHFEIRKNNSEPWNFSVAATVDAFSSIWFDIENEDQGLALLVAIGLANSMTVVTDDQKLIGLYDLTGSLRSAQAFTSCMAEAD